MVQPGTMCQSEAEDVGRQHAEQGAEVPVAGGGEECVADPGVQRDILVGFGAVCTRRPMVPAPFSRLGRLGVLELPAPAARGVAWVAVLVLVTLAGRSAGS